MHCSVNWTFSLQGGGEVCLLLAQNMRNAHDLPQKGLLGVHSQRNIDIAVIRSHLHSPSAACNILRASVGLAPGRGE